MNKKLRADHDFTFALPFHSMPDFLTFKEKIVKTLSESQSDVWASAFKLELSRGLLLFYAHL